ncbi:hypothetical protein Tco_0287208 [Tanacetum coccineum]
MITDKRKLTKNYRMYAAVFRVDVPTTQSQPIESTQGMHRTNNAHRSPNPVADKGDSSALLKSTIIRLRIPPRRSTRLTPPTPIPTTVEADDIILQDTIQLSLAEQKSHDELEANQNVQKVEEHLIAEEIEKLVEGSKNVENVEVDSSTLRKNDNQIDPDTREPMSNKESSEVEINVVVQPVNVNEEEEESAEDDYELKRREKRKHVEESRSTPSLTTIRSPRIHSTLISSDTKKLYELTVNDRPPSSSTPSSSSSKLSAKNRLLSLFKPKTGHFKRYKSIFDELQGCYEYLFEHLKTRFMPRKKFHMLAQHLQEVMEESLPKMGLIMERQQSQVDVAKMIADAIQLILLSGIIYNLQLQQDDLLIWLALKYKFEKLHVSDTPCRPSAICPRDQDDPHDDAHPEGENSPSTSGNQEQLDATDDDELPTEKVSQELVEEMSRTVDEAKLRKVVNEMLRQRCT